MRTSFTLLFSALMTLCSVAWAQTTTIVKGKLLDKANNESVIGASIVIKGTATGTTTDMGGQFLLKTTKTGNVSLQISSIGYQATSKDVTLAGGTVDLGTIQLESDAIGLEEVQVVASVAVDRKTPVAVSTIKPEAIEEKLGTQEFPEVLKSTPGVYATKAGGGYGDSRVNLRGFSSANIAVMINGIPVNDMENGSVYWSNWAGLADVTRTMQVQRGLGASRLAVPSVGGTINILTKTTDAKAGGSVFAGVGNDGYFKQAVTLSTGSMNGWSVSLSGSRTAGNGWVDNTSFEGWSYFANISKKFNAKHTLAFTAFGATQEHDQRRTRLSNAEWEKWDTSGEYRFNADWGYSGGEKKAGNNNYYHKPQISLSHYWTLSDKTDITTSAYASFGRGGGSRLNSSIKTTDNVFRDQETGLIDFDAIRAQNQLLAAEGKGSKYIMLSSMNEHNWYGMVSNVNHKINENWNVTGGLDLRYYKGMHYQKVDDFLGGSHYTFTKNEQKDSPVYNIDDKVTYNNDGMVQWQSVNAQVEYSKDKLSAFANASVSHQGYKRVDHFKYAGGTAETDWVSSWGYSAKAGANYNITGMHNVFANVGYFSRQPFMNSVFVNNTNIINEDAVNEKIFSGEIGYGLRSRIASANVNAYYTNWMDRSMVYRDNATNQFANVLGIDAVHYGVEVDFEIRPIRKLTITGMASLGDWRWKNNVTNVQVMDQNNEPVGKPLDLYLKDVHVGDAAQTTAALGINYEVLPGLKVGADYNYYDRIYADFYLDSRKTAPADGQANEDSWKMPAYHLLDLNASYRFKLKQMDFTLYGKVNNVADTRYISDAFDGKNHDLESSTFFYGMGRTWSLGMKVAF